MIDTEALRKKIIDLSVQGKLTQQLPEDGNAEDLYVKIQEEKAKLIKEGKIKNGKTLPEIMEDEVPFEIPSDWKWVRIGDITHNHGQKTPQNRFCYIDVGTLDNVKHKLNENENIVEAKNAPSRAKKIVENGDVLYSTVRPYLHNICVVDREFSCEPIASTAFAVMHIFEGCMLNEYLYYWLLSEWFDKYANGDSSKGTLYPAIGEKDFFNGLIPLPPVEEQKRIVGVINAAFVQIDIVDLLQQQYESDREILKGKIIDAGIRGKLTEQLPEDGKAKDLYAQIQEEKKEILRIRGGRKDKFIKTQDDEKPFEIPSNWKWIRFGEVGLFKKGPFGSALTKSMFVPKSENAIKVYEQQHAIKKDAKLGTYYISHEYFEANMTGFEVKAGDIIVSCAGTIGETYTMPTQMEQGIINQALLRVTLVPSILNEFFLYYFDSNLKTDARNESNGMAIKNIPPFDVMKNWYFPLPPFDEQKRIAEKIDSLLALLSIRH